MLKMYLFCYEILLPRKLFHPQIYSLLQVLDLLFELLDLFIQNLDSLLMLLVLFEHSCQLLLFDHYLIEYGVVINQISSLKFCVSLEVLVLLLGVFDARTQGVRLSVEFIKQVRLGCKESDSFIEFAELIVIILKPCIVGFLLVLQQHKSTLQVLILFSSVSLSKVRKCLFLHMVEYLFVEFLQTGS